MAVSNWYSPTGTVNKSEVLSVMKAKGAAPNSTSKDRESGRVRSSSDDERKSSGKKTVSQYRDSVWDPPISCQRRILASSQYTSLFPLELTDRDYFNRLVVLFILAIQSLDHDFLHNSIANMQDLVEVTMEVEEFLNIIIANCSNDHASMYTQKFVLFYNQSDFIRDNINQQAKLFLQVRDLFAKHLSGYDQCLLTDISPLFEATKLFAKMTKELSTTRSNAMNVKTDSEKLQIEVLDLHSQYKIHKQFQLQRMRELGWEKPEVDFNLKDNKEKQNFTQITSRFEALKQQAEKHFLHTAPTARVQLVVRLSVIISDLQKISRDVSEDSDYQEADRLRNLLKAVEASITLEDRRMADEANMLSQQFNLMTLEFNHLIQAKKDSMEFKNAEAAEQFSIVADQLHKRMALLVNKHSLLLAHDDVKNKIRLEGTSFINADFLFNSSYREDKINIAGLVVKSGAHDILTKIEIWPGLSSLVGNKKKLSNSATTTSTSLQLLMSASDLNVFDEMDDEGQLIAMSNDQFRMDERTLDRSTSNSRLMLTAPAGFSQTIMSTLQSFEELQSQLETLLTPIGISHTELLCRLIGVRNNLHNLVEINMHTGNHHEKERLSELVAIVDDTIDADEQDFDVEEDGFIGRGTKRIDNIWELTKQTEEGINELRKFKTRARAQGDYTAAQAFESMEKALDSRVEEVEKSLMQFNLLDSDNDDVSLEVMDIKERIAREGTGFFTSDYIFSYSSGPKGHSIGSLAIVAGAGAVLRFIKAAWPHLTALGNSRTDGEMNHDFAGSNGTGPFFDMHSGHSQMDANRGSIHRRKSSRASISQLNLANLPTGAGGSLSNYAIDFRDPNALRLVGFDPKTLQAAGFSDIDILTAGYNAEQLKQAGFSAEAIFSAAGLSSQAIQAVGFNAEMLLLALNDFYAKTSGASWRKQGTWKDLPTFVKQLTSSKVEKGSKAQQQSVINQFVSKLTGVGMNLESFEIEKLLAAQNNIQGKVVVTQLFIIALIQYLLV